MYVFVYGTLRTDGALHGHLQRLAAIKRGEAETRDRDFLMIDLGCFPGVVKYPGGIAIKGELFECDNSALSCLDRVEGYPRFYTRERIPVVCNGDTYDAWIYLYNAEPQRAYKLVINGEWSND